MRTLMKRMHEAQATLLGRPVDSAPSRATIAALANSVPPPLLAYFLNFIRSGRRGVALVQHGVCGECHIRVCSSLVTTLAQPRAVHLCEHCGRFLLLPDDEVVTPPAARVRTPRAAKAEAMAASETGDRRAVEVGGR